MFPTQIAAVDYGLYLLEVLPYLPCILLAFAIEWILYRKDLTLLVLWRPTFVASFLALAAIFWRGWTKGVDMAAELRLNGEETIRLEWAIGAFAGVVALVVLWGTFFAVRRVVRDFTNARMPIWMFLLRLLPVATTIAAAVWLFKHGNSLVGENGLLAMLRDNGVF